MKQARFASRGKTEMQKRKLGRTGLEVSVLGYGAGAQGPMPEWPETP